MNRLTRMILFAILSMAVGACVQQRQSTNVLAVWDMTQDDPSAQIWNRELKRELHRHGIRARIEESFVPHDGYKSFDISRKLDDMEADGRPAGLIIAGGDMNLHMLYDSPDARLRSIPAVSFGAIFPTIQDRGRHLNIGIIKDTIDLVHNLELMRILWPETRQFVTDIDWTQSEYDSFLRDKIYEDASEFQNKAFINNIKLRYSDRQLAEMMTSQPDAMSLTALSLWDPWTNISTEKRTRVYPQYAFNPSSSRNRVIFYKNDNTTRQMTDDESFMAFCTAIPQQFEVCDSCAGGFLAPIDVTMRQVAKMAELMLNGNGERLYSILYLAKDYYLDWNVLRGKYRLEDIPGFIQIRNTTIKDTDKGMWATIIALFVVAVSALAAILIYLISRQSRKSRSIKRAMISSARESIRIMEEFDFVREESNMHIWSVLGDTIHSDDSVLPISSLGLMKSEFDEFYREKLVSFLNINTPGKYDLQVYGTSPISRRRGWMELRMLVKETEEGLEKNGVTVDINELKMAEARLIETHRRLVNAQERDSFISSISHEMRTPLNSILGFTQVITNPEIQTDEQERIVMRNAVVNYGDELTNIINNILALTRIENGAVQMTMERYLVKDMIDDICCEMDVKACSNSVKLIREEGPQDSSLVTDSLIFKIIVQNVIGNAIKFSKPGSEVTVSWEERQDRITVTVKDKGIGIDKNNQSLIFTRFYKIDQFSQGVGLGLSIAAEYISRMGGSITLESEPGRGSTFHLNFSKSGKEVKL